MLKKTIPFEDLDGNPIKKDFYFNLSKAELVEMNYTMPGGFEEYIKKISKAQDIGAVIAVIKEILVKSVGVKSEDGLRFIKNDAIRDEFVQSDAYSVLFMELASDEKKASDFITGLLPRDLVAQVEAERTKAAPAAK